MTSGFVSISQSVLRGLVSSRCIEFSFLGKALMDILPRVYSTGVCIFARGRAELMFRPIHNLENTFIAAVFTGPRVNNM